MQRWKAVIVVMAVVFGLGLIPSQTAAITRYYSGRQYNSSTYTGLKAFMQTPSSLNVTTYQTYHFVTSCNKRNTSGSCTDWMQAGFVVRKGDTTPYSYWEYSINGSVSRDYPSTHGWSTDATYEVSYSSSIAGWYAYKNGSSMIGAGPLSEKAEVQAMGEAHNDDTVREPMWVYYHPAKYRDASYNWYVFTQNDGGYWRCDSPYHLTIITSNYEYEAYGPDTSKTCNPPND